LNLKKMIRWINISFRRLFFRKFRYKLLFTFLCGNLIASLIIISSYAMFGEEMKLLTFSLLTFVAGLFSVFIDYYISQPVTQVIDELTIAANKVARGKFEEARVSVRVQSELAQLANAFNIMSLQLNESFIKYKQIEKARRDLVSNISHDLKTPLATIQVFSESILDGVLKNEKEERKYLKTIIKETKNIRGLIDQLAQLSEYEAGEVKLHKENIDLIELVFNFIKSVQVRLEEKKIDVNIKTPDRNIDCIVIGDTAKIYQVIANLINNSIKYTEKGGKIDIEINPLKKTDEVRVNV